MGIDPLKMPLYIAKKSEKEEEAAEGRHVGRENGIKETNLEKIPLHRYQMI